MSLEEKKDLISEDKKNEMVELNDDQVAAVAGGKGDDDSANFTPQCPNCRQNNGLIRPTGKTRKGSYLGIFPDHEYHCGNCGKNFWDSGPQD